jgi:hypothetical protein
MSGKVDLSRETTLPPRGSASVHLRRSSGGIDGLADWRHCGRERLDL